MIVEAHMHYKISIEEKYKMRYFMCILSILTRTSSLVLQETKNLQQSHSKTPYVLFQWKVLT